METVADTTTDRRAPAPVAGKEGSSAGRAAKGRVSRGGLDRVTVALFSFAAFLAILALLASQLAVGSPRPRAVPVLLRKVYRTTVIERVLPAGSGGRGGASVTQSESGSVSGGLPSAGIATRSS